MSAFESLEFLAKACLDGFVGDNRIRPGKSLKWRGEGNDQYATFDWTADGMIEAIASDGQATPVHFTTIYYNEGVKVEYSAVGSIPVTLEESIDAFRMFIGDLSLTKESA